MVRLLRRGGLERGNPAALGVDAFEDVLDRAVLPAGVHRLQDDQEPLPVLGVEPLLQVRDAPALRLELLADVFLATVVLRLARVHIREPERRTGLDPVARVFRLRRGLIYDEPLRPGGRRHRPPSRAPRHVQRLLFFAHEGLVSSGYAQRLLTLLGYGLPLTKLPLGELSDLHRKYVGAIERAERTPTTVQAGLVILSKPLFMRGS